MANETITEIPVKDIKPNLSQPRETFDKEKIKELSESILSNGQINPIIVRKVKDGYEIVAGERRWQAHKVAGLKTIKAIVKEYENEGQIAIESLIENVHREDLNEDEKYKALKGIMELEKIPNLRQLSKRTKMSLTTIESLFRVMETREGLTGQLKDVSSAVITETINLPIEDRKKVIKYAHEKDLGGRAVRELTKKVRNIDNEEVKKALFSDEINIEQAEKISKLKEPKQREQAIKEHKAIKTIDDRIEKSIKIAEKHKSDKSNYIQVVKVNKWIKSFRYSVTDSAKQLAKTFKILGDCVKFIALADDNQKRELEQQLDRFSELLERGEQLSEQIKEKL